jgi:hypothetical protein
VRLSIPYNWEEGDNGVTSPYPYGSRGDETPKRTKTQGERQYFDLKMIGFPSNISREYEKYSHMVMKL